MYVKIIKVLSYINIFTYELARLVYICECL
jgi:hypothetical protein